MKSLLLRSTCLSLAAGLWTAAHAQSDNIPIDYIRSRDWTFSVGARMSNEGAKVKFGRLGSVPSLRNIDGGGAARIYDNGVVATDGLRPAELVLDQPPEDPKTAVTAAISDPDNPAYYYTQGIKTETVDGQDVPVRDANDNLVPVRTGHYLKYQEGVTRSWTYSSESQLLENNTPNARIAMSSYSATSDGASIEAEGDSGAGVELALGRRLGRLGQRIEWGITGLIGITDINVKTSGKVNSTLHTLTDYYLITGGAAPRDSDGNLVFSQPTVGTFTSPDNNREYANSKETTTTLGQDPIAGARTETSLAGGAEVEGNWQIKGSYYMLRLGPNVRMMLTERISLNASVGFAGAYLGTKYRVDERLILPNINSEIREQAEDEDSQFIAGFYGELNAELWLTERTGFYAGATYENLGDYEQVLNGRTADVELSSGLGVRFGLITRF